MDAPITYVDAAGKPLKLIPGKTFVELAPPSMFEALFAGEGPVDGEAHFSNETFYLERFMP